MPQPEPAGVCSFAALRLRLIPRRRAPPSCPLAIPSDRPVAWEVHAIRLSNLLRASPNRASRNPPLTYSARGIAAVALRGNTSRTLQLRGYPASTTLARLGAASRFAVCRPHANCRAIPVRVLCTAARAVSSSVRESRFSGLCRSASLPPPPSRSSPPRCIGFRERTQP